MKSMTAYGRHTVDTAVGRLVWEIRSVNHRYLDLQVRLPEDLRRLEMLVRERLAARLGRGKVEASLRLGAASLSAGPPRIDTGALGALAAAVGQVRQELPDARIDALGVLQWPGVVTTIDADADALDSQVLGTLDTALADFEATREREGATIAALLTDRAARIRDQVQLIRGQRTAVVARQRQKLLDRLAELNVEHDPARLEQELVYVAQRLDIEEELDRLDHHVDELLAVLARRDPVGRRLDFLMQEFNREANTLGSKAADTDAVDAGVELKVLIEQMREQVQNVE